MLQVPKVGLAVHFHNEALGSYGANGIGPGPYAAVISQVSGSATDPASCYVNLTVFPPFAAPYFEGSVLLTGSRRYAFIE